MRAIDRRRYVFSFTEGWWVPNHGVREIPGEGIYYHESAMREAVETLQRMRRGFCFCEVGIGNPMMQGQHTRVCEEAQALIDHHKELLQ